MKNTLILAVVVIAAVIGYVVYMKAPAVPEVVLDPTPKQMTLSGVYECLPPVDPSGISTTECAFGVRTDSGEYYAVNFGQSAEAMEQFQAGARMKADGFVVIKEALSSDQWAKYNMKGIFTVTSVIETAPQVSGKIDINAVCDGALAYMSFPDGAAADLFVAECKEGKHPEVI